MVSAMLSPVSPSATGKTFRSLTSPRRRSSSAKPAATTLRKRTRLSSATVSFYTLPRRRYVRSDVLGDLAGLQAASTDVLTGRRTADRDANFLEVGIEAPTRRNHRVA